MNKKIINHRRLLLIAVILYQILFFLCRVVFRDVVIIPSPIYRPELTRAYLESYFDSYVSFSGKSELLEIVLFLRPIFMLLFLVAIAGEFRKWAKMARTQKKLSVVFAAVGFVLCCISFIYNRIYGQPYYLYMHLITGEILSVVYAAMRVTGKITQKAGKLKTD